ncbi:MAG: hypothetical protein QM813_17340 [Verrucomicrobiota bacterium]
MKLPVLKLAGLLLTLGVTNPFAWAAAPLTGDPVDCVNPLSGANGDAQFSCGNTVVAIVAPFGMTTWRRRPMAMLRPSIR